MEHDKKHGVPHEEDCLTCQLPLCLKIIRIFSLVPFSISVSAKPIRAYTPASIRRGGGVGVHPQCGGGFPTFHSFRFVTSRFEVHPREVDDDCNRGSVRPS